MVYPDPPRPYRPRAATTQTPDGPFTIVVGREVLASGWTTDPADLLALIHPSLRPGAKDLELVCADLLPTDEGARPGAESLSPGLEGSSAAASGSCPPGPQIGDSDPLSQALAAVESYYSGELEAPGRVPVVQRSGPFREAAWEVLRGIPPGAVLSYADYAARCGRPRAVRAAAGACAFNAAALFVPCHRVVRTDGSLGGFRYGVGVKTSLIAREARP
ncbi:methylated-DNA--[protein]-cysteine S-methyltransferase [Actinomyces sp. 2119]|uniref:Methylated-DNA--[protein]-cysteine S-methyltransferase n=2 Tax=Actinomycetaceae TaxID=2049 RepID=A0ABN5PRJ8_9ACTO|nr:methylated-DNA--[protein]-cysteine S-methyltransferase [Actinomyces lilanjuaniae]RJF44091.1 methylated-DNA--[protein]-cysteine S-methyltransferase [Actinomyces sp. 2119]